MRNSLEEFDEIQGHDIRKAAAMNQIQMKLLNICMLNLGQENGWAAIIEQEIYSQWIAHIERENPILRGQPFETCLQNRERLSALIRQHRSLVIQKIASSIESKILLRAGPSNNEKRLRNSEYHQWSKLADELGKKRRVIPIRKLVDTYNEIIFDIAPCWMVSPEALSAIFRLQPGLFDYVIFDEASQSAVERSLPPLYRGKHIVILGDEKQLRPFDLFTVKEHEDDLEEEEIVDESMLSESLLVLAKRIYGFESLSWHYRSNFQELIFLIMRSTMDVSRLLLMRLRLHHHRLLNGLNAKMVYG